MSQSLPPTGRPLNVLHVDDDPMNRRVVDEILLAFGHTGVPAATGEEALAHLASRPFDVVLMDIHMPQMSGLEVVRRLRALDGPARATPVIALTADVVSRRPEEYRQFGFCDFVAKPILVSRLLAALAKAANAAPANDQISRTG